MTEFGLPPVMDASPLIFLTKADLLSILGDRYDTVLVTSTVVAEVEKYGSQDVTYRALRATNWLKVIEAPPPQQAIQDCKLDPGEASVLAWAYDNSGTEAILDDLAGRRCAKRLSIPIRGTLGLVLAAKQQGQIAEAKPIIQRLRKTGMYLSDSVISKALEMVGEEI